MNEICRKAQEAGADERTAKDIAISIFIKEAVANGVTLATAYEAVFGAGSYDKLKCDLYDALGAA